jgi:capsular polysaccharide biosynthesis protein
VYELEDVTLFGSTGLCISAGEYVADSISPPSRLDTRLVVSISKSMLYDGPLWTGRAMLRYDRHRLGDLPELEIVAPLVPLWMGYYHWVAEMLPRVMGAERYYRETGTRPTLVVPNRLPAWARESLYIVTGDEYEIVPARERAYHVHRLVLPTFPEPSPEACSWLRKQARDRASGASFPEHVYISRRNANRRRVRNEDAVVDALEAYGFEPFALEEMSMNDQISLFTQAECIVGPHGAGLTNMIYGDQPTIVELFGSRKKTTFYRLARLLDNEYHFLECTSVRGDIDVDVDRLCNFVETAL